jgi:glycosidase
MASFKLTLFIAVTVTVIFASGSRTFGQANGNPWQAQNIYQIVTDRFFNGDVSNDNADGNYNPSAGQGVHGGDFKGIEQKLDYIKALGATAIWISPVVKNVNGDYHGYAGSDFYNVDPHWGTLADLQHLIQTAHSKGLLVIDDVVVNHGSQLLNSNDSGYPSFLAPPNGYNLFYRDNSKQYASPFGPGSGQSLTTLFHNNGFIQDFTNTTQVEMGSLEGLDDFRTESSYVQTNMANIYKFWLEQGFDGFRVDTVKHVDQGFWQNWCPQIHSDAASHGSPNFFMFGEVYDSSETKNASYTGTISGTNFELDSVLDYPLYFSISSVFARGNSNTKQIEDHYNRVDSIYDPSSKMRLVTFLDNHDQPRFLNSANANNNTQRLNIALAFLYTSRGIPCLYYGTEQAFNGGADPGNREDMFAGQFEQGPSLGDNFNETHPLFQLVASLNNLRRLYPAIRTGLQVNLWSDSNGPGLFAYSRVLGSQEIFVALNTAGIAQTLPSRPSTYAAGTVLVNALNQSQSFVITSSGQTPPLTIQPASAEIFVAQSQFLPLDPMVASITPGHDAQSVPPPSAIVIQFSKPMDTASVEAAFSTLPATTGSFTWSTAHDQVTYQATGGLPALTALAVHLASSAAATDGTQFYAPFEARFTTASQSVTDITPPTITFTAPKEGATLSESTSTGGVGGTAWDDTAVARIELRLDGGPWVQESTSTIYGVVNWGQGFFSQFYLNGWHVFEARAFDTAGNVSPIASVHVKFANVPGNYEQRIWALGQAGSSLSDCNQNYWDSDQPYVNSLQYSSYGFVGGTTYRSSNSITNICPSGQTLYQVERYSSDVTPIHYMFDCPAGVYQVTFLEAETFFNGPNQRRFDVYAQGQKVIPNLDIFATAGGANLGMSQTFTTTVSNALLDVEFKPVYNSARVSAIDVKKIADVFSDTDGIPDWWRLMYFNHATGSATDLSRAQDDADGTGMTNYQKFIAGLDPTNPSSVFRILQVQKNANGYGVLVPMAVKKTYQLQRSSSLTNPTWTNIGSPFTEPNAPGILWMYDPSPDAGGPSELYRVVIVQ